MNDTMNYTEQCNVDTAIEAKKPHLMVSPQGRTVLVPTERVSARLAAGYTFK